MSKNPKEFLLNSFRNKKFVESYTLHRDDTWLNVSFF